MWLSLFQVIYNRATDRSRGFGFVTMSTIEELEKAVKMFSGYVSCYVSLYFVLCDFGENGCCYYLMF